MVETETDLVGFLKARFDEDDKVAFVARDAGIGAHAARMLREVEAKRQLLDEHHDVNDGDCAVCVNGEWGYPTHGGSSPQRHPCRTRRLLTLPYADHPDYDESWRS